MKWSFAGVGFVMFGLVGLVLLVLFEMVTTNNENDYYLLKEVTEAAMYDSVDIAYYRSTGEVKIIKEKFVENFTRRFAASTNLSPEGYEIQFYDIIESPPKVSVLIITDLGTYNAVGDMSDYKVANRLDAILEYPIEE